MLHNIYVRREHFLSVLQSQVDIIRIQRSIHALWDHRRNVPAMDWILRPIVVLFSSHTSNDNHEKTRLHCCNARVSGRCALHEVLHTGVHADFLTHRSMSDMHVQQGYPL